MASIQLSNLLHQQEAAQNATRADEWQKAVEREDPGQAMRTAWQAARLDQLAAPHRDDPSVDRIFVIGSRIADEAARAAARTTPTLAPRPTNTTAAPTPENTTPAPTPDNTTPAPTPVDDGPGHDDGAPQENHYLEGYMGTVTTGSGCRYRGTFEGDFGISAPGSNGTGWFYFMMEWSWRLVDDAGNGIDGCLASEQGPTYGSLRIFGSLEGDRSYYEGVAEEGEGYTVRIEVYGSHDGTRHIAGGRAVSADMPSPVGAYGWEQALTP